MVAGVRNELQFSLHMKDRNVSKRPDEAIHLRPAERCCPLFIFTSHFELEFSNQFVA